MRTTISLPDDLHASARQFAVESHTTLTAIIAEALRETIARRKSLRPEPTRLSTCGGTGVMPGVDLNDSAGLLDLTDPGHDAF